MSHSLVDSVNTLENKNSTTLMKVSVSRQRLASLIGTVSSIVPSRPALPILTNVLVEAKEGLLFISATDLTVSIKAFIEAEVLQEGAITLPARKLFQLIRELTHNELSIECSSNNIAHITSGASNFRINGMHKSEYPSLPDLSNASYFHIPASQFKDLLSTTSFAAAREDNRQVLNGVKLEIEDATLTLYGTDGKRLAKVVDQVEDMLLTLESPAILPVKAVEEVIRILDSDEKVKVAFTSDLILLETSSVVLTTKLLFGQYPDVEKIIPYEPAARVSLHKDELITLLKQVSLFTSETSHSVRFTFDKGELELSAMSRELGEGRVSMPADFHNEKLEIAFNPYFFLDILRHCKDEIVSFGITDSFNPGIIHDGKKALFVIMPMRLHTN